MKAAIFDAVGSPLRIDDMPMPEPGEGEVVLRVDRCGICGSDLHMTSDPVFCVPAGTVLGHELAGTVVARGPGVELLRGGDRVTAMPIGSCGQCSSCLAGEPARCAAMALQGGGYAQYVVVHERQCLKLPDALSDEDGALVEPLAVGLHGVALAALEPGARVMIVGAGPIGLAVLYWARRLGASRIGITASSLQRRPIAMEMGADAFIAPGEDQGEAIGKALGGPPDVVFECVGKPGLIARCIDMVRPGGTVVVLGLCIGTDHFQPLPAILKQVRIQMAAFYNRREFEVSIDALDAGHVEPRAMVTDRVPFSSLPDAFEALRSASTQCKVMVMPNADAG